MGIHFHDMVPQFSTVYFYLVKFGFKILTCCGLCQDTISTLKLSIYVENMLTKFHENQGPINYFFSLMQTRGPISPKCKNTIIMLQCKTYL